MTCLYRADIGLSYTVGNLLISTFQIRGHLCSVGAHCSLIGEFTVFFLIFQIGPLLRELVTFSQAEVTTSEIILIVDSKLKLQAIDL